MVSNRLVASQQFGAIGKGSVFNLPDGLPIARLLAVGMIALVGAGVAVPATAAGPGSFYIAGAATGSDLNKPKQTIANAPTPGSTLGRQRRRFRVGRAGGDRIRLQDLSGRSRNRPDSQPFGSLFRRQSDRDHPPAKG